MRLPRNKLHLADSLRYEPSADRRPADKTTQASQITQQIPPRIR